MERWYDNWMNSEPNLEVKYADPRPLGMKKIGSRHMYGGRREGDTWHVKTDKGWSFKFNAKTYRDEPN